MKRIISLLLAFILLFSFSTVAFAEKSPAGDEYYEVTIIYPNGDHESFEVIPGDTVELELANGEDKDFIKWEIKGEYEIISGSLTGDKIVIRPLGDLTIKKIFKDSRPQGDSNDSEESPQTGDIFIPLFGILAASSVAAVISRKKSND